MACERRFDFLQNLSESARAQDSRLVLCASIPKSLVTEMTPEDQEDYTRLKNMLDRLGKAVMMSADSEIAEIIRRRLFEWSGLPSEANGTIQAYAEWVADNKDALSGLTAETAAERFRACYPFHPSLLSVFERKWQSLPASSGLVACCACSHRGWQRTDERTSVAPTRVPLIELGSAPLDDPQFRAAMFEQMGSSELEAPITADIAGSTDSHALRLDRQASEEMRKAEVHKRAATVILFESNGGQMRAEATIGEVKAAVGRPDTNLALVDPALEGLVDSCYYLAADRNRYRVSLTPQLNKVLSERKAGVSAKAIDERLRKEIQACFQAGPKGLDLEPRYFPAKSVDVPDRPVLTIVVMGPDQTADVEGIDTLIEGITRECGSAGRTFKSALIFAVADSAQAMTEQARELLAWEDIDDDDEIVSRLDDGQRRQLAQKLAKARSDLRETIWRSYRGLRLLGRDNAMREENLGNITSSMAESMVDLILQFFMTSDEIVKSVGPNQLARFWPGGSPQWSTKAIRDAFYTSPLLPKLLKGNGVRRTIADGVSQRLFGYARPNETGGLRVDRFNEPMSELEVEISDEAFLLKAADAVKMLEPPRATRLALRPASVSLKPGDAATFSVDAWDQCNQPFPVPDPAWTATGGVIDESGRFVAASDTGCFSVHAVVGTLEGAAEVRISVGEATRKPQPPSSGTVRWSGAVPPQKWMNFYTKVVTRFATTPGLKLTVTVEAPVPANQAKSKTEETKTALRELGLTEDVE